MEESAAVREGIGRFFDRLSAGNVASFDDVVSSEPATLVIGSAPGEWVTERDRLRYGFEAEGYTVDLDDPEAYEVGGLGWVVDNPTFHFGDLDVKARLTACSIGRRGGGSSCTCTCPQESPTRRSKSSRRGGERPDRPSRSARSVPPIDRAVEHQRHIVPSTLHSPRRTQAEDRPKRTGRID